MLRRVVATIETLVVGLAGRQRCRRHRRATTAEQHDEITITAEVKQEREKKEGDRVLRNERYFGNIYRSFTLPAELDQSASEATYDNGILELKLVRKAAPPGKRLAIR